jgi:hypothetical protein
VNSELNVLCIFGNEEESTFGPWSRCYKALTEMSLLSKTRRFALQIGIAAPPKRTLLNVTQAGLYDVPRSS